MRFSKRHFRQAVIFLLAAAALGFFSAGPAFSQDLSTGGLSPAPPPPAPENTGDASLKADPGYLESALGFSFDVFGECLKSEGGKKNVFISPYSIGSAVMLVYNGSGGRTKEEIEKALRVKGMDIEKLNASCMALRKYFLGADPKVTLEIANSMWSRKGLEYKEKYVKFNKFYHDAEIRALETAKIVNDWVSAKTHDKIKDLLDESAVSASVMVLVNAVYFKGAWTDEFNKRVTKEEDFNAPDGKMKCQMMSNYGRFDYFESPELQAICLRYGDGRIGMYVFLPSSGTPFGDFMGKFGSKAYSDVISKCENRPGTIRMPKFRIEYSKVLNDVLKAIGVREAFTAKADFSRIFKAAPFDIFISMVIHKTFVDVNEEGTEAAAATAVTMAPTSAAEPPGPPPFEMVVDRPFFFAIADLRTRSILFMGAIVEPK